MSEYKNGGDNNMLWEQGVAGSNPATPTQKRLLEKEVFFFISTYRENLHVSFDRFRISLFLNLTT